MLILGLLLLACTAAFVGLAIADNIGGGPDYDVTMLGHHIATMNSLAIFCAGLALALLFGLAAMMVMAAMAMHRRRGRKVRAARRDVSAVERERDELAARLDRIHAEHQAAEAKGGEPLAADREQDFAATRESDLTHDQTSPGHGAYREPAASGRRRHGRHLFGH